MKFLKKITSASEAVQTDVNVLYATDTEVKITKALPSFTYSVKNISSPSVNWNATSATINFTGVKAFNDGTVEETEETQTVEFEQNPPQGDKPMQFTANTEFVDLGLPSGLKWAKCNLGAQSETEVGAYFSWGDTNGYVQPTDKGGTSTARDITDKFLWNDVEVNYTVKQGGASGGFTWATDKWNGGASDYDATYFASVCGDVLTTKEGETYPVLKSQYDAATANLGEGYRMPTTAEYDELTANTTSTWCAKGNTEFNGVAGRKFTSKTDSSKYIFIPAVGLCNGGSFYYVGSDGDVWASSLNSANPSLAWGLYFDSGYLYVGYLNRYNGFSVRAVSKN